MSDDWSDDFRLCEYGCGNDAKYKVGERWCCSKSHAQCPAIRAKRKNTIKKKKQKK